MAFGSFGENPLGDSKALGPVLDSELTAVAERENGFAALEDFDPAFYRGVEDPAWFVLTSERTGVSADDGANVFLVGMGGKIFEAENWRLTTLRRGDRGQTVVSPGW